MDTFPNAKPIYPILFGLICAALLAAVLLLSPERGGQIALEDGPLEAFQALFYGAGFLLCLLALKSRPHRLAAAVWAILCFVFLGEETSWFQRIFDYSVPAVEQVNIQGEFNFHNLTIFDTGRLIGEDKNLKLSLQGLLTMQNIFRIGFFTYFLALPLACLFAPVRNWLTKLGYVFGPPVNLLIVAWVMIVISFVCTVLSVEPIKFYVSEVREAIYASIIFIYTLTLYLAGRATSSLTARS